MSRCQPGDLAARAGVRSRRSSSVTTGVLRGDQTIVETRTVSQARAVLGSVVAWRDACNPEGTGPSNLGISGLILVTGSNEAYRWTFVFDPTTDGGVTTIEQVVAGRAENRVAVVVVSTVVPAATARTIDDVDMAAIGRATMARLT